MGKHIILVHFCILSGTGSNVYCANLAQQWKRQGHSVTIFCQDPDGGSLEWVDEFYGPHDELPADAPKGGIIRVITPDIANLLPLLVYDEYKGYDVKIIPDFTQEELDRHIRMMATAIRKVIDMWGADKILSNHAVLQPINVKRALEGCTKKVPFDIKIHGSGIIFVLEKHPRFIPLAVEAINECNKVIAGSQHIVDQVLKTFPDLDLSDKLVIVPPGMNPDVFDLCTSIESNTTAFLKACEEHIKLEGNGRVVSNVKLPEKGAWNVDFHNELVKLSETYNQRVVDADISARFPKIAEDEPIITYFGKFLYTKGTAEILMAFPRLIAKHPKLRLILVGFGTYREHLELMLHCMVTGNKELFKAAGHCPDEEGHTFLETSIDIDEHFMQITQEQADRVLITGCLNHKELGLLLPMASISIVASKANEAFGMVTVEALAAGVLPLCVYHSGIKDVLDKVKETQPELEALMNIPVVPGGDLGTSNGANLLKVLPEKVFTALDYLYPPALSSAEKVEHHKNIAKKLREVAEKTWSWDSICTTLVEL
ncbi:uncharacterized protein LOC130645474 [Hydractinia symbiolongicarpus]|uniref:uncharacterized protein LOC130645474 n=1 Tax=Hydractinia symbiolongicarpus TaxID=13093 RepID=UPI00254B6A96|nr:uncharacterized protein LOC130645474 [Hydractinia symbiolongicarpus]